MNRCRAALIAFPFPFRTGILTMLTALVLCAAPLGVSAQSLVRNFPAKVERALMQITQPPEMLLNGKPERLSPGARIRGTNNLLLMSAPLIGQKFEVNLVREPAGEVHEVWILTEAEAALKLPTGP